MTNGEKFIHDNLTSIPYFVDKKVVVNMEFDDDWWNAEYQEPTTKNDLVTLTFSKGTLKYSCKDYVVYKKDWLRSHYGAEIDIMFGDSQYKKPTTKNDLEVDAISRSDVLKLMQDNWHTHNGDWAMQESMDDIRALPSVTPIRPKGHWILTDVEGNKVWHCNCSECGKDPQDYIGGSENWWLIKSKLPKFCPSCGSDNREVIEE